METNNNTAPFSCVYTPNVPELLAKLNCSLAITTYQAGKLIFISPKEEEFLIQLPRTFLKPMGIAYNSKKGKLGIACKDTVELFQNSQALADYYPNSPKKYDALFMPRATLYSGGIDVHDLRFGNQDEIYGVNTLFSCLVKFDSNHSFTPIWQPKFISKLVSEDRCHLNGMVLENGKPKYVTCFSQTDTKQGWRENITKTGALINVDTNEIICDDLAMPHSPMLIDNKIFLLQSATGELLEIDPKTGEKASIINLQGFVRGMSQIGDYLFIGLSKLRKNSSTFAHLEIADKAKDAGIAIVHLPTKSFCGEIKYRTTVDEIYDIEVIPDFLRPNIVNNQMPISKLGITTPNQTFWGIAPKAKL